jgi:hypothetical protein
MATRRIASAVLISLLLATAIHTDWHFARPEHHRLSLGLSWHWMLAAPAFAMVAWYVSRMWRGRVRSASLWIVGGAVLLAGVLEPAFELFVGGATVEWTFGAVRTCALLAFVATGLVAYIAVLMLASGRGNLSRPGGS